MSIDPIPENMLGAMAYIFPEDAGAAMSWYAENLDGTDVYRMPGPRGRGVMHGEMTFRGQTLMLSDANAEWGTAAPVPEALRTFKLMLYVEDVDAVIARCAKAGAVVERAAEDMFWGDRMGEITDPFGQRWVLATRTREVSQEELDRGVQEWSEA